MNNFIKLNYAGNKEKVCVRKKDIVKFNDDVIEINAEPQRCTKVVFPDDDWIRVEETVDEIFWMLEDRDSYE